MLAEVNEMSHKQQTLLVASSFIIKTALIALSLGIDDEIFLQTCADLFHDVEKDPKKFIKMAQIADEVDIHASLSYEDLKNHTEKMKCKVASLEQRLSEWEN